MILLLHPADWGWAVTWTIAKKDNSVTSYMRLRGLAAYKRLSPRDYHASCGVAEVWFWFWFSTDRNRWLKLPP
jgi:hypothetical protein